MRKKMTMTQMSEILVKYANHPDFIGINLAEPNQRGAVDDAPLHIAVRRGTLDDISELLEVGANINLPGDMGNTPLHYAAMAGRNEVISFLLTRGANPKLENEFSETPLKVAQQGGKKDVVHLLKNL